MIARYIGQPQNRVDGPAKVTGSAKYSGEFPAPDLLFGVEVSSAIAKGSISRIDTDAAMAVSGVVKVFTHKDRPGTAWFDRSYKDDIGTPGAPFRPLHNGDIHYSGQPIALVVAETFELARYAASLVKVEYKQEEHHTDLRLQRKEAYVPKARPNIPQPPKARGEAEDAWESAAVRHRAEYDQPIEHHNPMEMFATTVVVGPDSKLTIYDKTQGVHSMLKWLQSVFSLGKDDLRVVSPFVGGAFGSGLRPQHNLFLAVMAALDLKRSVRVSLTRQQMFTFGHRAEAIQEIALGAARDGGLQSLMHKAFLETSTYEDNSENVVNWSELLYGSPNTKLNFEVAKLDMATPMDMRAPGAATGVWAIETAMDELAYRLQVDPLELRLRNYTERDEAEDKPFSSKELRACYEQGAKAFGWGARQKEPRSMREGRNLVGWGMATGVWDAFYQPAGAKAVLSADGRLRASSGTADIGTGTYTIMTQIAAETMGLPIECVTFELGDTELPESPLEGGSWTAASVGAAVYEVCEGIGKQLLALAQKLDHSPFEGLNWEEVQLAEGRLELKSDPGSGMSIVDIMRQSDKAELEEVTTSRLTYGKQKLKQSKFTSNTHSAVFVEVKIDEDLGTLHVTRVVSAVAAGRILNPKTARSQVLGGVVWGLSMALLEESVVDHNYGRIMNHNFAEYHIPVNADIPQIEVIFVEEHDDVASPLGVKGVGEIGIVGVAGAVSNAVFHATGKRIRSLPITLDKIAL